MRRILPFLCGLALAATVPGLALAASPPANDLPSGAIALSPTLPQQISQDTTGATVTPADDVGCGAGGLDQATVWYTFTPTADVNLALDATGSSYTVGINVFSSVADAGHLVNCFSPAGSVSLTGGTTYYLMFADVDGNGINGGDLEVALSEAPPPIAVHLTVNARGQVSQRSGTATLSGTITCDRTAQIAEVDVFLSQAVGRLTISGFGFGNPTCGPTPSTWTVDVTGQNGRFGGGKAQADVSANACDAFTCGSDFRHATVQLARH